jgi:hypothetical protein
MFAASRMPGSSRSFGSSISPPRGGDWQSTTVMLLRRFELR